MKYIILNIFLLLFAGCASHMPDCYTEGNKNMKLRWGYYLSKPGIMSGYQLNSDASLFKIYKTAADNKYSETEYTSIDGNEYCKFVKMAIDTIMKFQILSEPGDSLCFIEFENLTKNTRMRAVWNPVYKTIGSSGFRKIYDSLQTLIPVVQ